MATAYPKDCSPFGLPFRRRPVGRCAWALHIPGPWHCLASGCLPTD